MRIVTLTLNPAVDKSTTVKRVVPEKKLRCETPRYEAGGGGINVSKAVKRLGGDSRALITVGGLNGRRLEALLADEDVATEPIEIENETRQNLIARDESSEEQYRFGMAGPKLDEREWRAALDRLREIDPAPAYVVASGSLPPGAPDDFYAQVCEIARERDARAIVDTHGEPLRLAAEAGAYLLKPNARELADMLGKQFEDEAEQEALARQAIEQHACEALVLSLGSAGVLLADGDGVLRMRAPSVRIRSKVGAGDSMVAGIVHGLSEGRSLRDATRLGVAAGTAAVMTPGSELCRRADTERLYEQIERAN